MLKAPYRIAMRRPVFERPLIGSGDSVIVITKWFCTAVRCRAIRVEPREDYVTRPFYIRMDMEGTGFFILQER